MATMDDAKAALLEPRQQPDAKKLLEWVRGDVNDASSMGVFEKLQRCDRLRSCWTPEPTSELGDEGEEEQYGTRQLFPWKGAINHMPQLVDMLCNEEVALALLAWFKSQKTVLPRQVMSQEQNESAQLWRDVLEFELDQTKRETLLALMLFWNCVSEFGHGVMFEGWQRRRHLKKRRMSWAEVKAMAGEMDFAEAQAAAGGVELPPEVAEQVLGQSLQRMEDALLDEERAVEVEQVIAAVDPEIAVQEARRLVRAFRRDPMSPAVYYAATLQWEKPERRALIPFIDVVYPPALPADAECPRFAMLEWMSEQELRVRAELEGWDEAFTEKVLQNPGLAINLNALVENFNGWQLNGMDIGMRLTVNDLKHCHMYQVLELWYVGVSKAGVPAVYRTILHECMPDKAGLHECDPYGTGRLPFLRQPRTMKRKLMVAAKGVPDEMMTFQLGDKKLLDAIIGQSELRSNPPLVETMDSGGDGLRPGARLPVAMSLLAMNGGARFMDVPDVSGGTVRTLELLKERRDEFYARGPNADPDAKLAKRTAAIGLITTFYEQLLEHMCSNVQENVGDFHIGNIGARPVNRLVRAEELHGELDVSVSLDVSATDLSLAVEKLKALREFAIPLDRNGRLNFDQLMRYALTLIDGRLLDAVVLPPDEASERIVHDEQDRLARAVGGVVLDFPEQVENPQLRLQVVQQWLATPGNAQRMASDPVLAEQISKEIDALNFQVAQYQENPIIGLTGVEPGLADSQARPI